MYLIDEGVQYTRVHFPHAAPLVNTVIFALWLDYIIIKFKDAVSWSRCIGTTVKESLAFYLWCVYHESQLISNHIITYARQRLE